MARTYCGFKGIPLVGIHLQEMFVPCLPLPDGYRRVRSLIASAGWHPLPSKGRGRGGVKRAAIAPLREWCRGGVCDLFIPSYIFMLIILIILISFKQKTSQFLSNKIKSISFIMPKTKPSNAKQKRAKLERLTPPLPLPFKGAGRATAALAPCQPLPRLLPVSEQSSSV